MGSYLTDSDTINGEGGSNQVDLAGGYADLVITNSMMQNIERLNLAGGSDYMLILGGGISSSGTMTVNAAGLVTGDTLLLSFEGDSTGQYIVDDGAGTNQIYLNDEKDTIVANATGNNDIYAYDGGLLTNTKIEGAGQTELFLGTGFASGYTFGSSVTNLTEITLSDENYKFTLNNANVAGGGSLVIDSQDVGAGQTLNVNGSHITSGTLQFFCGAGGKRSPAVRRTTRSSSMAHTNSSRPTGSTAKAAAAIRSSSAAIIPRASRCRTRLSPTSRKSISWVARATI
jgi:hypothetical protein